MRDIETVIELFRTAGLKMTPQRMTIFNLIWDNRSHPCAEEIYRKALDAHPTISFTTVYKTLQTLRDMGEILQLSIDPERAHFDPVVENHAHRFCLVCRRITDHANGEKEWKFLPMDTGTDGFTVHHVHVHFVGVCGDCRSTPDRTP